VDELTVDQVYGIFIEELRKGDGLTTKKLRKHPELVKLLVDDGTPEDAKAELEAIVLSRGDELKPRALRNSLAISNGRDGIESRGGPELRRKWATGADGTIPSSECLIDRSIASHVAYEKEEFREVAELIFDRAAKRARLKAGGGAFQAAGEQQLTEAGYSAPFTPAEEVTDSVHASVREDPLDQADAKESVEPEPETSLLSRLGSWAEQRQQALAHSWEPRPLRDRLNSWKNDWAAVSREAKIFLLLFTLVVLGGMTAALITLTR
jgi:hypothetical protein